MSGQAGGAGAEWRKYWYLPLVAGVGYSTSSLQAYGIGPFIAPVTEEFGWTRAQFATGLAVSSIGAAIFLTTLGPLIDKYGPRRMGLIGVVLVTAAFALLAAARGSMADWWLHWALISAGMISIQGTIWTGAVVSRFHAARGTAIAVTVSGNAVASAILPPLGTWLIGEYGWRGGFLGLGLIWLLIVFPLVFLFFRGAQDDRVAARAKGTDVEPPPLPGVTVREGVRRPAFYKLLAIGAIFSFTMLGTIVHFVPILTSLGNSAMGAASVAALIGIFSIIGRLATGVALDRFPAHIVGFLSYLIPVIGGAALLLDGGATAAQVTAAVTIGLTLGAEVDVIIYLGTRHFGLRNFGTFTSALFSSIALGTALGPLAAGALFDRSGSYTGFIAMTVVLTTVAALITLTLRCPPEGEGH